MPSVNKGDHIILQFGYGDLYTSSVSDHETGEVVGIAITQGEPREIGTEIVEHRGESLANFDVKLIMQFDSIASLDVVMDVLQRTKDAMTKQQEDK